MSAPNGVRRIKFLSRLIGLLGLSMVAACSARTFQLQPPSDVLVSWTANKETAVNRVGGGYRVYHSKTKGFDVASAEVTEVPYVSGDWAPTSVVLKQLSPGTYYIKVVAYSSMMLPDGSSNSVSPASPEILLSVP